MAQLDCIVATPEGPVFDGKIRSLVVPATDGELGILPRHAPLVAALGSGELRLEEESGNKGRFFLSGGFVQVLDNRVTVLATEAEAIEAVDRREAEKSLQDLLSTPPATGASLEERNDYHERLRAARARLKLAGP